MKTPEILGLNKNCGLLWEFPGGKVEPGETGEQYIIRECQEELSVTLQVRKSFSLLVVVATLALIAAFVVVVVKGRKKKTA